jgi:ribosomal protein S18 acetylase RimI-like enzyme
MKSVGSWMKTIKKLIIFSTIVVGLGLGSYFFKQSEGSLKIQNFNFDTDADDVETLFHKGDNFYWMIAGNPEYSVKFMLKYKTTSQEEKTQNLILKSAKIDGKIVGFLAYYQMSAHVGRLLFLIVDQEFRKQGVAKKLLNFAVKDMVSMGDLKILLFTRSNNFKAQSLYKSIGFKIIDSDETGVWMSWYKK